MKCKWVTTSENSQRLPEFPFEFFQLDFSFPHPILLNHLSIGLPSGSSVFYHFPIFLQELDDGLLGRVYVCICICSSGTYHLCSSQDKQ